MTTSARPVVVAVIATALMVSACGAASETGRRPAQPSAPPAASSAAHPPASSLPPLPAKPAPLGATSTSPPVRVQIPAIGVDSTLEDLGLLPDGSLASPSAWQTAGWYDEGVRPGDPGPAIIAGHVDSYLGPAVFYRLGALVAGDSVTVTRADHAESRFVVDSKAQYPKAHFPTGDVYGPTPTPELRLITCTGIFDRSVRSYEDNLVVTAVLAS